MQPHRVVFDLYNNKISHTLFPSLSLSLILLLSFTPTQPHPTQPKPTPRTTLTHSITLTHYHNNHTLTHYHTTHRELAMQSHQVVVDVGGLKSVCIYGGVPKPQQKADLKAGAEVVVATPGRLLDLLEENVLSLSGTRTDGHTSQKLLMS